MYLSAGGAVAGRGVLMDEVIPAAGGRSATEPDPTEWIWLRARDRAGFAASP